MPAATRATVIVNVDIPGPVISRHLYGHFAEHLGRCIFGGFWVGADSPIPDVGGIRQDVVQALRELDIPNLRWPGGDAARRRSTGAPMVARTIWGSSL